jgi:outer membrane biosynthesis protein TonB
VLVKVKWTDVWPFLKSNSIARAFGISIALHLIAFVIIDIGNRAKLWDVRFKAPARTTVAINPQQQREQQIQLQFIEVPNQQAEEPKDAKYYSSANSEAANPDTKLDTQTPKVDGNQDKIPKTQDTARADPPPPREPEVMQPAVKPSKQVATATPQPKPDEPLGDTKENTLTPEEKAQRDLTMDRPAPKTQPRPRTLADARAQKGMIEGPKTKQDGGVKKYALEMSPAAKMTPFGSYDAMFIAAVQKRWFDILDARSYASDQTGRVVVEFKLYKDGRIVDLKVTENDVTTTLSWACERAILDPAPYAPFPPDLKRLLGADFREVRFTFYYN